MTWSTGCRRAIPQRWSSRRTWARARPRRLPSAPAGSVVRWPPRQRGPAVRRIPQSPRAEARQVETRRLVATGRAPTSPPRPPPEKGVYGPPVPPYRDVKFQAPLAVAIDASGEKIAVADYEGWQRVFRPATAARTSPTARGSCRRGRRSTSTTPRATRYAALRPRHSPRRSGATWPFRPTGGSCSSRRTTGPAAAWQGNRCCPPTRMPGPSMSSTSSAAGSRPCSFPTPSRPSTPAGRTAASWAAGTTRCIC